MAERGRAERKEAEMGCEADRTQRRQPSPPSPAALSKTYSTAMSVRGSRSFSSLVETRGGERSEDCARERRTRRLLFRPLPRPSSTRIPPKSLLQRDLL